MPHPEREMQIEVARLRYELKAAQAACVHEHARVTAAESERDALRAALQKHGCHEVECDANKEEDDQFCNCGLTAALAGGGDRG